MEALCPLLACPRCDHTPLTVVGEAYRCEPCRVQFPVLAGVPWLFAEPQAAQDEWRARFGRSQSELESERDLARLACGAGSASVLTRSRLTHLVSAYEGQIAAQQNLLAPLLGSPAPARHEAYLALRTRLPVEQGLATYAANLFRDWTWGEEENAAALSLVRTALGRAPAGPVLVLGSGGGRLAYDLHRALAPERTMALDLNPLLCFATKRIVSGEALALWEFPLAPRGTFDGAVSRTLSAPAPAKDNFHVVLADALRAPFPAGTFDIVITPWLIDIVQDPPAAFAARINRLLRGGGTWINFGSLAFARQDPAERWSLEEVLALVESAGFTAPTWSEAEIPYLCSPASRHGRRERVVTFAAHKRADAAAVPRHEALPDWIARGTTAVPLAPSFQRQAGTVGIHAFIMSLIDGRRSLKDMARVLEERGLMPRAEAEGALRSFLTTMYDESRRPRGL